MPEHLDAIHPTGPEHRGVAERGVLALVSPALSIRKHRKGSWLGFDLSVAFHVHSTQPAATIGAKTPGVGCVELAKRNR